MNRSNSALEICPTTPVVLVCQAGTRAHLAAELLQHHGKHLVILEGGTGAWIKASNPAVCCTASRWALERQVRLIAGLLVILCVALGVTVSPLFLILAAFIGCGLTFVGTTDICPMGEILARLPWNRIETRAQRSPRTDATIHPGVSPAAALSTLEENGAELADRAPSAETLAAASQVREMLHAALNSLPPAYRAVYELNSPARRQRAGSAFRSPP